MTSPRLLIPELTESQASKYLTHNEAVRVIDGLLMPVAQNYTTTPPGSPTEGQVYLIDTTATGAWAGHDEDVAQYYNGTWYFYNAAVGWWFWNVTAAAYYRFNGSTWEAVTIEAGIKVSANDTTPSYLNGKLVAGTGISLTEGNDGANETLTAALALKVSAGDTTPDPYLEGKLAAGNGLTMTVANNDADETLTFAAKPQSLIIAASDETTALTAGTNKVTFRMPYAFTVSAVRASLTTAQTGGNIFTVDINEGGATILSTKLTIDNAEKSSTTATTAAVISDTSLADDAEITVDIDQIGDGTAKGLKVILIGYPT